MPYNVGWTPKTSRQFNTGGGGGGGNDSFRQFRTQTPLPKLGQYDYLSNFKNMLSYMKGPTNPQIGEFDTGQISLPAEYQEDPYSFKSVDPEAAINAARGPIQTEMQRGFAEAGARYGAAGALNSQSYAEFGLGKAAGRASEDIASMTEAALYDASKFNRSLEAQMAEGRQNRLFGGYQARGAWDVGSQQDYEARRLAKRGQDIEKYLGELGFSKNESQLNANTILSLLGMQGPQENQNAWDLYNAQFGAEGANAADRAYYANLFGGMDYGKGTNIMKLMGFDVAGGPGGKQGLPGGGGLDPGAMGGDNPYEFLISMLNKPGAGGSSGFGLG